MQKETVNIIDPHLHLFDVMQGEYCWLKADNPPFWPDKALINRTFTVEDLCFDDDFSTLGFSTLGFSIKGFVHIEAGFDNAKPWRELAYLEQSTSKNNTLMRTIAGLDLSLPPATFTEQLVKCQAYKSFVGIRHILDGQGLKVLSSESAKLNMKKLDETELIFEVQISFHCESENTEIIQSTNLGILALIEHIKSNNNTHFIINHSGLAPTSSSDSPNPAWLQWLNNLASIAAFPNVFLKFSGAEMSNRKYQQQWLNQVLLECITLFGTQRIMLASNFPLCLFSQASYQNYWLMLFNLAVFKSLSKEQKKALSHDNAFRLYKFSNK